MFGYVAYFVPLSIGSFWPVGHNSDWILYNKSLWRSTLAFSCIMAATAASAPSSSTDRQQLQVFAVLSVPQAKAADFVSSNDTGFPRQLTKWIRTTTDWNRARWSNLILVTAQWECSYAANSYDRKLLQPMQSFSVNTTSQQHSGVNMNVL